MTSSFAKFTFTSGRSPVGAGDPTCQKALHALPFLAVRPTQANGLAEILQELSHPGLFLGGDAGSLVEVPPLDMRDNLSG